VESQLLYAGGDISAQGYGSSGLAATIPVDYEDAPSGIESWAGASDTIGTLDSAIASPVDEEPFDSLGGDTIDIPIGTAESLPPAERPSGAEETVPDEGGATTPVTKTELFAPGTGPDSASGSYSQSQEATLEQMMASSETGGTGEFTALGQAWIEKTVKDFAPPSSGVVRSAPAGYEFVSELGRGGMGIVYKARQLRLNRLVALKMIRGAYADEIQLARFKIEAEAVATLRHPNILQIYDIGEHNGAPFVALELLEGGSLAERLNRNPLPPVQAAQWMLPLVLAMDTAHRAGIVHRDLKSANILFTADGTPKITDFGLAKRLELDEGQTHTGQIMGTPSYMAPEQARGETKSAGPPADIYALGAILYEMLTGRPPFKGVSAMDTVKQVLEEEPVSPSRVQFRVPRDLETICMKCLQKEPHKRFATAKDLADDLNRYLRGEPIRARRTPPVERAVKWSRRRPALATLIGCATLAAATLMGTGIWYWNHKRAQERNALEHLFRFEQDAGVRLLQAREAIGRKELDRAHEILTGQQTLLGHENNRALAELSARTDKMLAEVDIALKADAQRQAQEQAREEVQERYRHFLAHHKEALFRDTQFTDMSLTAKRDLTRKAAEEALDVFASRHGDDWQFGDLPAALTSEQQTRVKDGWYEMLLMLAEVGAEQDASQVDRALRILDCADHLRPEHTRAYHLRKAALLARKNDSSGSDRELALAERARPETAFDYYLSGREEYKRARSVMSGPLSADRRDGGTQPEQRGGPYAQAIKDFGLALRKQPDHFWANCLQAICYINTGRFDGAKACLNSCINDDPEFAWLYLLRAFASGQRAATFLTLAKAETSKEAASQRNAVANDEFNAAGEDLKTALEALTRKPDVTLQYALLVNRGLIRFQRGQLDEAAADYRAAIRLNRDALAHAELARVLEKQGKPKEAIAEFSAAIKINPVWAPLYRGRAALVQARADSTVPEREAALADLNLAISHEQANNPVLALDHTNRATLLYRDERFDEALEECRLALGVVPDYVDAHILRIRTLLKLGKFDDVVRSCDVALRVRKSAVLYELRALAEAKYKDYPGAIRDYGRALELLPNEGRLLVARGWQYLLFDSAKLALVDFEKAIAIDRADIDAHLGRGTACARLGDYRAAVIEARDALRLGKPTPRVALLAARIYAVAASTAAAETGEKVRLSRPLASQYQDTALQWIKEAFDREAPEKRAAFWRDMILPDPAFNTIRRRLKYEELIASNKRPGS
jgi:tetratricopeptide (TPR) repeat protein/tRNA A-37 threonylcarbamoyl transferase component Bud32